MRVELRVGDSQQVLRVRVNGSYASSSDPRLLFGLGDLEVPGPVQATVVLRDGSRLELTPLELGRYNRYVLVERNAGGQRTREARDARERVLVRGETCDAVDVAGRSRQLR